MIAILDYGMGNLRSVEKALERVGAQAEITRRPEQLRSAEAVVLPGVGAFPQAMENLRASDFEAAVLDFIRQGKPFLGICLGQQLLFERSKEFGSTEGLGVVAGEVVRFEGPAFAANRKSKSDRAPLKVPHMGWNEIRLLKPCPLFAGVESGAMAYFVHSYYGLPREESWAAAATEYGVSFASALWKDNVYACQFHPEKSGQVGLRILRNFARIVEKHRGRAGSGSDSGD
jgi:glutamine amidotransferase